jgi:ATP-dependent Clp endopeptidase proteolytic subunit ClpP
VDLSRIWDKSALNFAALYEEEKSGMLTSIPVFKPITPAKSLFLPNSSPIPGAHTPMPQEPSLPDVVLHPLTSSQTKGGLPVFTPSEGKPMITPPSLDTRKTNPLNHPAKMLSVPQIQYSTTRFGHQITDDYVVEHRLRTPVNAYAVSKTLRAQILRDLSKRDQDDSSNLKYSLNALEAYHPIYEAALGDNFVLLDRDVDTVVQSHAGPGSVNALMMTRLMNGAGKRYISKDAMVSPGPATIVIGGKNHDEQVNRELANEYLRDKETLVMLATGETNRLKVNKDLNSAKEFNALQALNYGKHGFVDAILLGKDRVLTREKLQEFYRSKGFNAKQVVDFNSNALNVDLIPQRFTMTLKDYAPESLVNPHTARHDNRPKRYFTFENQLKSVGGGKADQQIEAMDKLMANHVQVLARAINEASFKMMPRIPFLKMPVSASPDMPAQFQIRGAIPGDGLVYDDLITFNDGFDDDTGEQIHGALEALEEKKKTQKDPSHIKILINSPGGSAWSGQELRSAIAELDPKVKVDVIVQGMAASCGSYLLASATGNRLSTPTARIMIHQGATGPRMTYSSIGNQEADSSNTFTDEYAASVAKASGRDLDAVRRDFRQDTWLNPLEAMFYGSKGLLDGVMVASNKAITRNDVLNFLKTDPETQRYLTEKFPHAKKDKVSAYLDDRLRKLREPNRIHDPQEWEEAKGRDPFDNPVRTIMAVAAQAKAIKDIPKLRGSATRPQSVIDQFVIGRQPLLPGLFGLFEDEDDDEARAGRKRFSDGRVKRLEPAFSRQNFQDASHWRNLGQDNAGSNKKAKGLDPMTL